MNKTEAEITFDFLVSKVIWPHFKEIGYKKSGNNFRYYDKSGWGKIVNFQKSMFYSKEHIHFTVNIGLYLAEVEQFHCGTQSFDKFHESMCIVRRRIGDIPKSGNDLWFDLSKTTDRNTQFNEIEGRFLNDVLPYLNDVRSKDDIVTFLVNGWDSGFPIVQIKTLLANGHRDTARNQLEARIENTRDKYFLHSLKQLRREFI